MSLYIAVGSSPENAPLRVLRRHELARTIAGKQVQTDSSTPERKRLQVTEHFHKDGRYLRESQGREALGYYRFDEDAVCVQRFREGSWQCKIAVVDGQGRMWFIRSLEPAHFEQVVVSEIPK